MARRLVRAAHTDALHFANDARMLHSRLATCDASAARGEAHALPHTFSVSSPCHLQALRLLTLPYFLPGQHGCVPCFLQ